MREHISVEQLKDYGRRRLSEKAMTSAIIHLQDCRACFDLYRELFPAETDLRREILLNVLTDDFEEPFHLDYEQYLRPLADGKLDAVSREIVDSHLRVCSECARAVRDLQEFRDGLMLHQIMRNENQPAHTFVFAWLWHRLTEGNARRLTIAFTLLTLTAGGIYLAFENRSESSLISSIAAPEMRTNANFIKADSNPSRILQPEKSEIPDSAANGGKKSDFDFKNESLKSSLSSTNKTAVEQKNAESVVKKSENSVKSRNLNEQTLTEVANEIKFPRFLAEITTPPIKLRGNPADRQAIHPIFPVAKVLRTSQPVFRWDPTKNPSVYRVKIFDSAFNEIAASPQLKDAEWQPSEHLPRGCVLLWQVKVENSKEEQSKIFAQSKFYILSEKNLRAVKRAEQSSAPPLEQAAALAGAGLLDEAETLLMRMLRRKHYSREARRLLKQISEVKELDFH